VKSTLVELLFVLRPLTPEPIPDELPKSCLFADQIDRPLIHSPPTGRSGMRRPQQLARYFNNVGRGI
jgi:hypothetical protein